MVTVRNMLNRLTPLLTKPFSLSAGSWRWRSALFALCLTLAFLALPARPAQADEDYVVPELPDTFSSADPHRDMPATPSGERALIDPSGRLDEADAQAVAALAADVGQHNGCDVVVALIDEDAGIYPEDLAERLMKSRPYPPETIMLLLDIHASRGTRDLLFRPYPDDSSFLWSKFNTDRLRQLAESAVDQAASDLTADELSSSDLRRASEKSLTVLDHKLRSFRPHVEVRDILIALAAAVLVFVIFQLLVRRAYAKPKDHPREIDMERQALINYNVNTDNVVDVNVTRVRVERPSSSGSRGGGSGSGSGFGSSSAKF